MPVIVTLREEDKPNLRHLTFFRGDCVDYLWVGCDSYGGRLMKPVVLYKKMPSGSLVILYRLPNFGNTVSYSFQSECAEIEVFTKVELLEMMQLLLEQSSVRVSYDDWRKLYPPMDTVHASEEKAIRNRLEKDVLTGAHEQHIQKLQMNFSVFMSELTFSHAMAEIQCFAAMCEMTLSGTRLNIEAMAARFNSPAAPVKTRRSKRMQRSNSLGGLQDFSHI
jgi:hypothetical protein